MSKLLLWAALAAAQITAMAAPIVYVTNFNDPIGFGTVDLSTGVYTAVGTIDVGELTRGPGGSVFGFRENGDWVSVNASTGATTFIGASGIAVDEPVHLADGTIYATDLSHNLYTINPNTGVATLVGSTGFADPLGGLFNVILLGGDTNTLYAVAPSYDGTTFSPIDHARLFQINRSTGAATFVANAGNDFITCGLLLSGTTYVFDFLGGISALNVGDGGMTSLFDLSSTVGGFHGVADAPEPGSLTLAAFGAAALGFLGLRRRK